MRREDLQGDLASEPEMLGEVDDAHATSADHAVDPVAGELLTGTHLALHAHRCTTVTQRAEPLRGGFDLRRSPAQDGRAHHPAGCHVVIGRSEEVSTLRSFVADPGRWPAATVVEGEPGIGKSTLWRAALDDAEAAGHRVLRAAPDEPDRASPFGVLTDLLEPLVAELGDRLPDPQRHAVAVAMLEEQAD